MQEIVRDPMPSCRSFPLGNLRMIKVKILEYDQREIDVLSSFLEGCSALERMEIKVSGYIEKDAIVSFTELFYVRRASLQARVNIDLRG